MIGHGHGPGSQLESVYDMPSTLYDHPHLTSVPLDWCSSAPCALGGVVVEAPSLVDENAAEAFHSHFCYKADVQCQKLWRLK